MPAQKKKVGSKAKYEGWCFTINNPKAKVPWKHKTMRYLRYGLEHGEEEKTPHWQGYVQFYEPKNMSQVKALLETEGHVEIQRGPFDKADNYAGKDGDVRKYGVPDTNLHGKPKEQGKRNDLKDCLEVALEGKTSLFKLGMEYPSVMARYRKFIIQQMDEKEFEDLKEPDYPIILPWFTIEKPDPTKKKRHYWLTGSPDTDKSYLIEQALKKQKVFKVRDDKKYHFEDYRNEDIILYDDTSPSREELIGTTNTHMLKTHVSGAARYENKYWKIDHSRTVIVVTNPEQTVNQLKDDEAIQARFNMIDSDEYFKKFVETNKELNAKKIQNSGDYKSPYPLPSEGRPLASDPFLNGFAPHCVGPPIQESEREMEEFINQLMEKVNQ